MAERTVRRGTVVDAPELVRLRALMLEAMGVDVGSQDAAWRDRAVAVFEARLSDTQRFAAFVVDAPGERLAASAVAWLDQHLPTPAAPDGWVGSLASVSTDLPYRRQGLARLCTVAAQEWLAATGVAAAHLFATPDGEPLYRGLGWSEPLSPALVRRFIPGHL